MTRKLLAVVAAGLMLGAGEPGDERAIREVKQALGVLNEAFEKGDAAAIRKLMTDDHRAVTSFYGGAVNRDEQIASVPQLKLTEYKAEEMRVTLLGRDAALVAYRLTMKGTFKGTPVPPRSFASAVWVKREGRWLEAFYQETALAEK
jgi:uncharacterized protein (TIGR02246 family)